MAFPAIAAITSGTQTSNSTSHSVTLTDAAAGELLLVLLQAGSAISWTMPSGWTSISAASGSVVAARIADGTEPASVTFTSSSSNKSSHLFIRVTGAHASTLPTAANTNYGGSTSTFDPPNLAPSGGANNYLWLAVAFRRAAVGVSSYPTDYSDNQTNVTGSDNAVAVATRELNASSENPAAYTLASSTIGSARTVAIYPMASASTGSVAVTEAADTLTASATVAQAPIDGNLSATEAADTCSSQGLQEKQATAFLNFENDQAY